MMVFKGPCPDSLHWHNLDRTRLHVLFRVAGSCALIAAIVIAVMVMLFHLTANAMCSDEDVAMRLPGLCDGAVVNDDMPLTRAQSSFTIGVLIFVCTTILSKVVVMSTNLNWEHASDEGTSDSSLILKMASMNVALECLFLFFTFGIPGTPDNGFHQHFMEMAAPVVTSKALAPIYVDLAKAIAISFAMSLKHVYIDRKQGSQMSLIKTCTPEPFAQAERQAHFGSCLFGISVCTAPFPLAAAIGTVHLLLFTMQSRLQVGSPCPPAHTCALTVPVAAALCVRRLFLLSFSTYER